MGIPANLNNPRLYIILRTFDNDVNSTLKELKLIFHMMMKGKTYLFPLEEGVVLVLMLPYLIIKLAKEIQKLLRLE